jgi:uncharacterized protein (DUF2141 family)
VASNYLIEMLKNRFKITLFFLTLLLISCAKRGTIDGGVKDTIAPVLKLSFPANYSTNFKGNSIKLTFDEYVKLKNINKQLIISPPLSKSPTILPQTASKYITVHFNDSLQANTTYSMNFGESIEDNNEGNPYRQFKYVFSTGSYIDSLTLGGSIKDAYDKKAASFVSVMLYEVNSKFNDSIIYKENPRYITNTLDSSTVFKLENLKAGKYLLVAVKDENSDNKFNPKKEKIGFHKEFITLPNDSVYQLSLFKEIAPFKAFKPSQASGNRFTVGYEGKTKNLKVTLKDKQQPIPTIVTKLPEKDSVQIWYKPLKIDSVSISISNDNYAQEYISSLKNQKNDTLSFSTKQNKIIGLSEIFSLKSSIPIESFDVTKMKLINKDSVAVAFKTEYDEWNQELKFNFKKEPLEKYTLKVLSGAMKDYLEHENDSLTFVLETKNISEYGNLTVNLQNVEKFPVIVELTNTKGDIIASHYSESTTKIDFFLLEPNLFTLRVIYDDNKNREWDSGNFLEKKQAEKVIYFPKEIDVRANWDVEQSFNLKP